MKKSRLFLIFSTLFFAFSLQFRVQAAPTVGPLIRHFSSLLKWTRSSSKAPHSDENVLQFENGYLVETVVEGTALGVVPHSIRVSEDGELFAVDAVNNNIVRITPPLSQYSRARLVAGSFQGHTGHIDGKPSDARFNSPKGVTMDDKGNVYVADTANLAIRKIGDSGVTTIAGGKSTLAGYRDGPSENAKFSSDFDVVYVRPTCSLLVVDRGNAALRQISLSQEDCDYQNSSISATDIFMVIGAVVVGYATCLLQKGFGPSSSSKMPHSESDFGDQLIKEKPTPVVESIKEEPDAGWPSFGQLIVDLSKLMLEALTSIFFYFIPSRFMPTQAREGLTPLKDRLIMPEDEAEPPLAQKQRAPPPLSETRQTHIPNTGEKYSEMKPPKIKSYSFKEHSLPSKHKSSKRQEYAEFYNSGEVPPPPYTQLRSKSQKERSRHRQRDKSGEVAFGAVWVEPKPVEIKAVDYDDPKFDHYNIRSKYGPGDSFRF